MASDVEVIGVDSLIKDLRGIAGRIDKKNLVKIIRPGAQIFRKAIIAEAPMRDGYLRKAVRIKVGKGKATDPGATVSTYLAKTYPHKGALVKPYYAWYVEHGTKDRYHKSGRYTGRITPRPFVSRAWEMKVDEVARMILDAIDKMTNK